MDINPIRHELGIPYSKLTSTSLSNESEITQVHAGGADDIDDAVQAARQAFGGPWARISGTERGQLMLRLADLVEDGTHEFATIDAWNNGRSPSEAMLSG